MSTAGLLAYSQDMIVVSFLHFAVCARAAVAGCGMLAYTNPMVRRSRLGAMTWLAMPPCQSPTAAPEAPAVPQAA